MNKKKIAALLSGIALLSINSAFAADVTGNFQTTSTLVSSCTISAQDIAFGTLNMIQTSPLTVQANGGINILCSKSVTYTLTPAGGYTDGTTQGSTQLMRGTGVNKDAVLVQLMKGNDGSGGGAWGRTNTGPITGTATGLNQFIPVQGSVTRTSQPKLYDATSTNQHNYEASPDVYSATVTATISY